MAGVGTIVMLGVLGVAQGVEARSAVFEIRDLGDRDEIDIPLKWDPGIQRGAVEVVDVAFGARRGAELSGALERRPESTNAVLKLFVDTRAMAQTGRYEVVLGATGTVAGQRFTREIAVALEHPPASLRMPATLHVDRVVGIFGVDIEPDEVAMEERSSKTRISRLVLQQVGQLTHNDRVVSGRVRFDDHGPELYVAAGGTVGVPIAVDGAVPLGLTRGAAEASAPQLAAPVPIGIEIHSRRPRWWVPVVFAFGLALGFFFRTWLRTKTERAQLEVAALPVLRKLQVHAETHPEVALRADLKKRAQDLAAAIEAKQAEVLPAQLPMAAAALKDAEDRRNAAQRALFEELAGLQRALSRPRDLPAMVAAEVTELKARMAAVERRAEADQLREASEGMEGVRDALASVESAARSWAAQLKGDLEGYAERLGKPYGDAWSACSAQPIASATAVGALGAATDAAKLEALLDAVDRAVDDLQVPVWQLANRRERLLKTALRVLGNEPRHEALRVALRAAAQAREGGADDRLSFGVLSCESLHDAVEKAVRELAAAGAMGDEEVAKILELVHAGSYAAALEQAHAARTEGDYVAPARGPTSAPPPDPAQLEAGIAAAPASARRRVEATTPPVVRIVVQEPVEVDLGILGSKASSTLQLADIARTGFSLLALPALAYVSFGEAFIGTVPELVAIAGAGFVSDMTIDSVVGALSKLDPNRK